MQRQNIKHMLNDWNRNHPGRIESMFTAMKNIVPSHMCDSELFDFKSITSDSGIINGGDTAFDREEVLLVNSEEELAITVPSSAIEIVEVK